MTSEEIIQRLSAANQNLRSEVWQLKTANKTIEEDRNALRERVSELQDLLIDHETEESMKEAEEARNLTEAKVIGDRDLLRLWTENEKSVFPDVLKRALLLEVLQSRDLKPPGPADYLHKGTWHCGEHRVQLAGGQNGHCFKCSCSV